MSGVFSDEHGDYPAGSYLLNPEGFSHAPFSDGGCVLFVKLRQYPGLNRTQIMIDTAGKAFPAPDDAGVQAISLYRELDHPEQMDLVRLAPGGILATEAHPGGGRDICSRRCPGRGRGSLRARDVAAFSRRPPAGAAKPRRLSVLPQARPPADRSSLSLSPGGWRAMIANVGWRAMIANVGWRAMIAQAAIRLPGMGSPRRRRGDRVERGERQGLSPFFLA